MLAALALQLIIGMSMVLRGFPLWLATAHTAGAALLLLATVGAEPRTAAARMNSDVQSARALRPPGTTTWSSPSRRIVALIVLTSVVGSLLAAPGLPRLDTLLFANLGIALAAAGAAVINHVLDRGIDARMRRTRARPLPTGHLKPAQALLFARALSIASMLLLVSWK